MSKTWRMMERIRNREIQQQFQIHATEYAKDHELSEVTAPDVNNTETAIDNEHSLDTVLENLTTQCDVVVSGIRSNGVLYNDLNKDLRILRALCQIAIAKIETGW